MQDRDLIAGVLAAQAGFATPSEVLSAVAAGLVDSASESLLTRLQRNGTLSLERRKMLEALAEQALVARGGDARAVLTSLGAAPAVIETLVSAVAAAEDRTNGQSGASTAVPLERPGQYTRLRELGRGSQSIVRAARDEIVGREVALRELVTIGDGGPDESSSRAARARFLREVRLVAGLDHPGIVSILELARREDGTLFCAQKLIRGETLQLRLTECRSLGERLGLLRHVLDACQAVGYAHAKRVIHRDLKPSNVMVGEYGETVVVDWGLAKHQEEAEEDVPLLGPSAEPLLTVAGVALGTPAYMSPEQARGDLPAIDTRSDVFSLGAILYQVLTGRPPFDGATAEHVLENVRSGNFHRVRTLTPEAPPELAAIAEQALRSDPSARYPDAEALAKELSAYLGGGRVRAHQYGAWELLRKFVANHRALTTGMAVGIGGLLLSGVVVAVRLHAARRDLASAFIERAYTAEREGDWTQAAAYFAAARVQRDTPEARWGVALAGEGAAERILSLHGPPESFIDVGVLPDGRIIGLGYSSNGMEVRELESGTTLWSWSSEPVLGASFLPGGQVRLGLRGSWVYLDGATGRQLATYDRNTFGWPCPGHYPTLAFVLRGQLSLRSGEGPPRPVATLGPSERCAVSGDARQLAYQDSAGTVQLVAVDDGRTLASRPGTGLREMLFSRHGLVLVKLGRLEVFGGPDGDFTMELPEGGLGDSRVQLGARVSPDGNLVAVPRLGSNRSDVLDLRGRSIRATLTHASGWPRFAFSLDGQRVYLADLRNGATLSGWRLPPPEVPNTHAGNWETPVYFSSSGRRLYVADPGTSHYELYGPGGELLASQPVDASEGNQLHFAGDGPVVARLEPWKQQTVVRDLEQGRALWARPCRLCVDVGISADGSRVVHIGPVDRLEVWDTKANRLVFKEVDRVGPRYGAHCAVSPDGRRVAWSQGRGVIVRDLDSGREWTVALGGDVRGLGFSPDSASLASGTTGSIALWDGGTGRSLWRVITGVPDNLVLHWSAEGQAVLLDYDTLGTELFDARTGEKLARFQAAKASVSPTRVYLQPDLRAKVVITPTHWERRPLPEPVTESPAQSLARTLKRTGLELQGVELVAAP